MEPFLKYNSRSLVPALPFARLEHFVSQNSFAVGEMLSVKTQGIYHCTGIDADDLHFPFPGYDRISSVELGAGYRNIQHFLTAPRSKPLDHDE
ncbi:unnamed protein product [Phytophthora lilii]|uniref:Unnamed protein product n=1 Tax=Phytophthora lilii TaxID=2077276 RepID=A0A9W6YIL1_9STRA|nr:unnamed protein product [Phytophthora lilii]